MTPIQSIISIGKRPIRFIWLIYWAGIGLAVSAVFGCAHPAPYESQFSNIDIPENWTAPGGFSAHIVDLAWLSHFDDPQLTSLVREALARNTDLNITATRIHNAQALSLLAGAPRLPSINVDTTWRRSANPVQLLDAVKTEKSRNLSFSTGIRWELDLWGRLQDRSKAALRDVRAVEADWQAARLSLAGRVVKAWYQIIADGRQLDLMHNTLESYQVSERLVRDRFESGIAGALDLRLALSNVAMTENMLLERANQLNRSKRNLQLLLQRYPDGDLMASGALPEMRRTIPAGLPSQLLERRADIRAAKERVLGTDLRTSEAKKAMLPTISLTGDIGTSSGELRNFLNTDYQFWNLIANLAQPIFQGGRLQANLALARTEAQISRLQYAQTVLNAFQEVEQTLTADHFLGRRIAAARQAVDQAVGAEALALEAYAAGVADIVTVLEAQRRELNSKADLIQLQLRHIHNRVDVSLALGGDFDRPREG